MFLTKHLSNKLESSSAASSEVLKIKNRETRSLFFTTFMKADFFRKDKRGVPDGKSRH